MNSTSPKKNNLNFQESNSAKIYSQKYNSHIIQKKSNQSRGIIKLNALQTGIKIITPSDPEKEEHPADNIIKLNINSNQTQNSSSSISQPSNLTPQAQPAYNEEKKPSGSIKFNTFQNGNKAKKKTPGNGGAIRLR